MTEREAEVSRPNGTSAHPRLDRAGRVDAGSASASRGYVLKARCQQCGYPLDGEPNGQPCAECGTPWVRAIVHERGGEAAVFAALFALASVLGFYLLFGFFGVGLGYVAWRMCRRALVRVQAGEAPLWSANVAIAARYASLLAMALGVMAIVVSLTVSMLSVARQISLF